jgi:hypothetical protein
MIDFLALNYWAVIVVWILYMAVGAYWYSPAGFAKKWSKHTGVDIMKLPTKTANTILLSVALSCLIQVFTLAVILEAAGVSTALDGLVIGLLLWLGLTTATTVGTTLYAKRSWRFLWLNSAYFLVVMVIGSVILAIWR